MELTNDFRVDVGVAEAWKLLTDVERIAPLLPGAQLQEIEGDEYRGIVKVKVGPITAQYKGVATFLEQDEKAGRVVLRASGRDTRGQGNATATITATMVPDGAATKVTVVTDLTVTGKVAQFGRGVLADVSGKLLGQFVDALHADLVAGAAGGSPAASDPPEAAAGQTNGDGRGTAGEEGDTPAEPAPAEGEAMAAEPERPGAAATAPSGPRKINSPEPEPVDLLDAAGSSVAKRVAPVAGGVLVVLVLLILRRRRARRKAQRYAAALGGLRQLRGHVPDVHQLRGYVADVHLPDVHLPDVHLPDMHQRMADVQKLARRGR